MSKKSNFENNFEQIFNLPDSPPLVKDVEVLKPDTRNDDIESDYKYARENLYNAIERGSDALEELVELAKQSQSPRAFEIVGQMIKTLTDANKDLLEVQKKVKDLKKEEQSKGPNSVTNALFVGNTAELQKLLKDNR
jgi:DNA-binding ferritin-like protein